MCKINKNGNTLKRGKIIILDIYSLQLFLSTSIPINGNLFSDGSSIVKFMDT